MSLPFNPSNLSVKKASSKLASLSIEELEALRDAELAGKNRITLVIAIDAELSDPLVFANATLSPTSDLPLPFYPSLTPTPSTSQLRRLNDAALATRANAPVEIGIQFSGFTAVLEPAPSEPNPEPILSDPVQI